MTTHQPAASLSLRSALINSDHTNKFKDKWATSVNSSAALADWNTWFCPDNYSDIFQWETVVEQSEYESFEDCYILCRDKVCEMVACRAMARPDSKEEPRTVMVRKAKAMIDELEGVAPPELCLMMEKVS